MLPKNIFLGANRINANVFFDQGKFKLLILFYFREKWIDNKKFATYDTE